MHMNPLRLLLAAILVSLSALPAHAASIIDTIPLWDGSRSQSWDKAAQSFTAPASDAFLSKFRLGVGSATDGNYTVQLYDWDEVGNHAVGGALFDSGLLSAPDHVTFITFDINVALSPNETYAIIVDWDNGGFDSGVAFSFADQYSGGYNDYTDESIFDPWWFGPDTPYEMAFRATFGEVPAPGAMSLLGLAGLTVWRRRPHRS